MINVNDLNNEYYKLGDKIASIYFNQNKNIFLNNSYDLEDLKQETKIKVYDTLLKYTTSSPEEIEKIKPDYDKKGNIIGKALLWYNGYSKKEKQNVDYSETKLYPPDKPNEELIKLITNWVYNRLNEIKRKCLIGSGSIVCKCTNCDFKKQIVKYKKIKKCPNCKSKILINEGENYFIDDIKNYYKDRETVTPENEFIDFFEDIEKFCSKEEFLLLHLRFREYFTSYYCKKCDIKFTKAGFNKHEVCKKCDSKLEITEVKPGGTPKEIGKETNQSRQSVEQKLEKILKKIKKVLAKY